METMLTLELWFAYHMADIALVLAAWVIIALPLVLAMDRSER